MTDAAVSQSSSFGIDPAELLEINSGKDLEKLSTLGGIDALAKKLHSDTHKGIQSSTENDRKAAFGENSHPEQPPKSLLGCCFDAMKDPVLIILMIAAAAETILGASFPEKRKEGAYAEGVAIWVAVAIVTLVGGINDWNKDRQFRSLNAQKDRIEIKTIRDGQQQMILNTDIVVGDLVLLDTGDKVIADGILIDTFGLVVDEASLTGESDPIKKSVTRDPWIRSGTQVSEGSGRILVVAVGVNSEWGKTLALVSEAGDDATPLQNKLAHMAGAIGKVGAFVGFACFVILLIKWCIRKNGFPVKEISDNGPIQFFLYGVTILIVSIPEGLPLAVTIALAYSMKKMMKDNNFVRVLSACETMGGATAICSDKTGTLTENRMTVVEGWFSGVKLDHDPAANELRPELLEELNLSISLNSKAFLIDKGPVTDFIGNRTDCALLMLARKWGNNYEALREKYHDAVERMYEFSSDRKMASVLVRRDDTLRLYNKGAAEWVLTSCTAYRNEKYEVVPMTDEIRESLLRTVTSMAERGLRCICMTYRDLPLNDPSRGEDFFDKPPEQQLVAHAIVGIKDPLRKEVPDAVATCARAGITVRMVTGDNIHTAKHIAKDCGIYSEPDGVALEGPVFRNMPINELRRILPKLQVLARASPKDKYILVSTLKDMGEVVAVTGDGTNDAPALKEAHVGLAMGIAGTEVAKEAADIVILDDNFSSIVKSVLWGRCVFNNIRKFLQFQLTINFVALVVAFVGAIAGGHEPLTVMQLLWVNLIMDSMAALALATESPNKELLDKKPNGSDESLINRKMAKHILVQGIYQMFWLFIFLYGFPVMMPDKYAISKSGDYKCVECSEAAADLKYDANLLCPIYIKDEDPTALTYNATTKIWNGRDADTTCLDPKVLRKVSYQKDPAYTGNVPHQLDRLIKELEKRFEHKVEEDYMKVLSLLFNTFIFMQVFNEINARRIDDEYNVMQGFFESWTFSIVLVVTVICQIIIMFVEPIGKFFRVHRLSGEEWGMSIAIGFGVIPVRFITVFVSRTFFSNVNSDNWQWFVMPKKYKQEARSRSGRTASGRTMSGGSTGGGRR